VWAPNAKTVSVVGDFNGWKGSHALTPRGQSGIWEGFSRCRHTLYKYHIVSNVNDYRVDKADPFSVFNETHENRVNRVGLDYQWNDAG
jgi:1,4-alpha-glucan branching enzyme